MLLPNDNAKCLRQFIIRTISLPNEHLYVTTNDDNAYCMTGMQPAFIGMDPHLKGKIIYIAYITSSFSENNIPNVTWYYQGAT